MPELAWGARGRKFESCRPDQSKTRFLKMIVAKPVAKFKRCDSIRQPTAVRYQGLSSRRIPWRRRSVGRIDSGDRSATRRVLVRRRSLLFSELFGESVRG